MSDVWKRLMPLLAHTQFQLLPSNRAGKAPKEVINIMAALKESKQILAFP